MKRVEERQRRPNGAILDSIADIFDGVGGMQIKSGYRGLLLELTKGWSLCSTVIDEVQKSAPLNCIAGVVLIFSAPSLHELPGRERRTFFQQWLPCVIGVWVHSLP
jgi:hypothetical protein